jgi:hypothetical protein
MHQKAFHCGIILDGLARAGIDLENRRGLLSVQANVGLIQVQHHMKQAPEVLLAQKPN